MHPSAKHPVKQATHNGDIIRIIISEAVLKLNLELIS